MEANARMKTFSQKRTKQTKEMGISSSFLLKTATTDLPRQCYALIHDLFLRSLGLLLFKTAFLKTHYENIITSVQPS